jgi:hypothetical protein
MIDTNQAKIIATVTTIVERLFAKREKKILAEVIENLPEVQIGKKGDKGERGDVGPQGPKGDKGDVGDQGPRGFTGVQGPRGFKGDQGETGERGEQGLPGKDGADGKDGIDGAQGPMGPRGESGERGPKGDKGDQGPPGKDGVDGASGSDGTPGPQGPQGPIGPKGERGERGPRGPKGDRGEKGDTGESGPRGPQGPAGKDAVAIEPDLSELEQLLNGRLEKEVEQARQTIQKTINDLRKTSGWGSTSSGSGSYSIMDQGDVEFKRPVNITEGSLLSYNRILGKYQANNVVRNLNHLAFDTTSTYEVNQGEMAWNSDEETLDLGLNGATLQLGQEVHYHVRNNTGSIIPNGTAVMATGTLGASGRITIAPAISDGSIPSKYFIGITTEEIGIGEDGKVTHFGKVRNINTSIYDEGDILWPNPLVPGGLTKVEPSAGNWKIPAAIVISKKNNGTIFVRFSYVPDLKDLNDVETSNPSDSDFLVFQANNEIWTHKPLTEINQTASIRIISSNTSTLSTDYTILANCVSSNVYITLTNHDKKILNIKKIDASTNIVVLNGNVDNQISRSISSQYNSLTIHNLNGNWYII